MVKSLGSHIQTSHIDFHFENLAHTCAGSHDIVVMGDLDQLLQDMDLSFIALNVLNTNCTNKISKLLTRCGEMKSHNATGQNSHTHT